VVGWGVKSWVAPKCQETVDGEICDGELYSGSSGTMCLKCKKIYIPDVSTGGGIVDVDR